MYLSGRRSHSILATQRDELREEVRRLEQFLTAKPLQEARILVKLEADNKRLEEEKAHLKMQHSILLMRPDRLAGQHLKIYELAAERLTAEMPHFAQAWLRALEHAREFVSQEADGRLPPLILLRNLGGKIRGVLGLRQKTSLIRDLEITTGS